MNMSTKNRLLTILFVFIKKKNFHWKNKFQKIYSLTAVQAKIKARCAKSLHSNKKIPIKFRQEIEDYSKMADTGILFGGNSYICR